MLAFLGTGGERTDLGAHFFGLITGLVTGIILGFKQIFNLRHSLVLQLFLAVTGFILPVLAWYLALS